MTKIIYRETTIAISRPKINKGYNHHDRQTYSATSVFRSISRTI